MNELRTVFISAGCHFVDNFVHERLGKGRLVELIVTKFPIADKVNDDIAAKLLSKLGREFESALDIFHTISVDVENGRVNCFCDIRRVPSRSALAWVSGETNLVVDDDVDGTAYFVVVE